MNQDPEDFESLRRLMKLKRYEQPPPRYFKDFSSQVIARISAEQAQPSWLDRFASIFHARPALSGVLGAAACVLLLGTAVYSEGENSGVSFVDLKQRSTGKDNQGNSESGTMSLASVSSTNQIRMPGSLFDLYPTASALPAGFR